MALGVSGAAGARGGVALRASAKLFLASASAGTTLATLNDPYAGKGYGTTTYATFGTVPGQLALSGANINKGASAAVVGTSYAIGVVATSGDGKHSVGETLTLVGGLTLSAPTLSNLTYADNAAPGAIISAIGGRVAGDDAPAISPADGRVAVDGSGNLVVGLTPSSAGVYSVTLRLSHPYGVNSPISSAFNLTVTAAGAANVLTSKLGDTLTTKAGDPLTAKGA